MYKSHLLSTWQLTLLVAGLAMLAPFTLDTYLPSFPDIALTLSATQDQMQLTLSYYLLGFGLMMLVYGPLSDALGRRRVVLFALFAYVVASLGCALVTSIEQFMLFRALQGMAAGAGMVIGRAVVRDMFVGADAQLVMARVMLVFSIAPAVAPVIGGWLDQMAGWRFVFVFLSLIGVGLLCFVAYGLPETLSVDRRQSLHVVDMTQAYMSLLKSSAFVLLAILFGINFGGLFLYIAAAPTLLYDLLGYGVTDFWRLFLPAVLGIMIGSQLSAWAAHRWSMLKTAAVGMVVMFLAALLNFWQANFFTEHDVWWVITPIALYAMGMATAMTPISLIGLDIFPLRKGMASAIQGFAQTASNAAISAWLVTLLVGSVLSLASGMLLIACVSLLVWGLWWWRYGALMP